MKQSKTETSQVYDLSIGQKELWFIHSIGGLAQSAYNEPLIYTLLGTLKVDLLKQAFIALIEEHEALRTSFKQDVYGNVLRYTHDTTHLDFSVLEFSSDDQITAFIKKPFDLEKAPLMRIALLKQNEEEHKLVIVLHHIITDGTSFGILVNDLNCFYNQLLHDGTSESVHCGKSYQVQVEFEKNNSYSKEYLEQVDKVVHHLDGYATLNFLTTPVIEEQRDLFSGKRVHFSLNAELIQKITAVAKQKRATVFHVLYATYSWLISHYTRSNDVLIGVPFANRQADPDQEILGYFINTMPIRQQIDEEQTFLDYLVQVKTLIFSNLCRQNVAFEQVAPHLKLERKALGQHPLIQALFVWGGLEKLQLKLQGIESHIEHRYSTQTSKFDISLFMLEENKESVCGYFEYRDALFEPELMEAFARSFNILLEQVVSFPENKLVDLGLLNEQEQARMRETLFTSQLNRVVDKSLVDLFADIVNQFPNRTGLIYNGTHYDYAILEQKSNQWASYIRHQYRHQYGKELAADTLVALCVDRSEDMIFGLLGILKAGAAYVPVDPQYPLERMNYILSHSQSSLLLTHKQYDALGLDYPTEQIIYMNDESVVHSVYFVDEKPQHKVNPQDTAYVLYTSGSTGKPKGVAVTHENVNCLFASLDKQFKLSEQDVWSLFHTFCFDISVWEIWGAFLYGGALVVIPYEVTRDPKRFHQVIAEEKVTVLTQTASAFQMFINEDLKTNQKLEALRYVGFVGESLKVSILRPWVSKYGTQQPRLANLYGITETTVYTNYKFVEQEDIDKGRDNIGWPLEEFSMCVLDKHNQWCPIGIVGEICIGGRGLSKGYLYRDDLTRERFIEDPYAAYLGLKSDARLYRTGDLGRWMADGSIEYLGRKDFQIKLRGFRIELGEIEATLGSFAGVMHTLVLLKGEGDSAYLSAYFTVKPGAQVKQSALMAHLKSFLPSYMVPAMVTELSSFPMTVNGKIDRQKLHQLDDVPNLINELIPLQSALQKSIAHIWAEILKVPSDILGANSNFFNLGGNSLLLVNMLSRARSKLGLECALGRFITQPTIANLAEVQNNYPQVVEAFCAQLKQDSSLDLELQPLSTRNNALTQPKAMLITGANGFLGAYILAESLAANDAEIFCLIRAATLEEAQLKLVSQLKKHQLFRADSFDRVQVVLGDLALPKLGLSASDYERITEQVDSIIHVGARVHHVYDYQTLRQENVESVRELLQIAVTKKNKALHFISTLVAGTISPLERLASLAETSAEAQLSVNGYVSSKWAAEQLVQEAHGRGIAAYVYRPGNIIASSQTAIYEPENNHTLLRLKGMLQLGKGYVDEGESVEMMPVDCLAKAIVYLTQHPNQCCYNLNHSQDITWLEYLNQAKALGFSFQWVSNDIWNTLIAQLDETNALYKLSQFYKAEQGGAMEQLLVMKPNYLIKTPSYEEMIVQQLNALVGSGFLVKAQEVDVPA